MAPHPDLGIVPSYPLQMTHLTQSPRLHKPIGQVQTPTPSEYGVVAAKAAASLPLGAPPWAYASCRTWACALRVSTGWVSAARACRGFRRESGQRDAEGDLQRRRADVVCTDWFGESWGRVSVRVPVSLPNIEESTSGSDSVSECECQCECGREWSEWRRMGNVVTDVVDLFLDRDGGCTV